MKTTLLTAALLIAGCTVFAQNPVLTPERKTKIYNLLIQNTEDKLDEYCEVIDTTALLKNKIYKGADKQAFTKQFKNIFSTVVINNTDIVNNGSAFGYSFDDDKHKFSANMSFSGENWTRVIIDIGTNITNINDDFKYYADGAWANDIGLRVGFNYAFSPTQFMYPKNCEATKEKRELYIIDKLYELKEVLALGKTSEELETERDSLSDIRRAILKTSQKPVEETKKKIEKLNKQITLLKNFEKLNLKEKEKEEDAVHSRSDSIYFEHIKINDIYLISEAIQEDEDKYLDKNIDKYTSDMLTEFDEKNNDFHGYSIFWFNINANISNNSFKFSNDSIIDTDIYEKYTSLMKLSVESSINYNMHSANWLQYYKGYIRINRGSFLDAPNLKGMDITLRENNTDSENIYYDLVNDTGEVIQQYDNIRDPKYNMDLGGYYTGFFMFKKTLGLTARANFNFPVGKELEMNYKPNYTLLAGLAFRVASAEKWSSATFTINTGFENVLYDVNAFDSFIVKASIGVPFSIFQKKS